MITQQRLKEVPNYNSITGIFRWKVANRRVKVGDVADTRCGNDYLRICVHGERYQAHRLAWLYMTGNFPKHCLRHLDSVNSHNAWDNLAENTGLVGNMGKGRHHTGPVQRQSQQTCQTYRKQKHQQRQLAFLDHEIAELVAQRVALIQEIAPSTMIYR